MIQELEELTCLSCKYTWLDDIGPTYCPMCEHSYIKWNNYNEKRFAPKNTPKRNKRRKKDD